MPAATEMDTVTEDTFLGQDDPFLAMAKGIHDELEAKVERKFTALREEYESGLLSRIVKTLDAAYAERMKTLETELAHVKALNAEGNARIEKILKSLPIPQLVLPPDAIKLLVPDRPEDNKTLHKIKALEAEVASLKRLQSDGLGRIESMFKSLPTPQVVLPAEAIKVLVAEKPRKVEKSVLYGPSGRAEKIIETSSSE